MLLPLYYLRFYLDFRGQARIFDHGIVCFEYLPVWLMLAHARWSAPRAGPSARLEPGRP